MANGGSVEDGENQQSGEEVRLFGEEELRDISGVRKRNDCLEVTCGCTSRQYGDAVGKLRVFPSGDLEIACECTPGCQEDKLTPTAFEKHSGKETARKWKNNIWVIMNGEKVPLLKTPLLKYYLKSSKHLNASQRQSGRFHRDEFVRCADCNKERRFRLRTIGECRDHHEASLDEKWTCSDHPSDRLSCNDDEERASRKGYRGCSRSATCKGCMSCVCFGCYICRFSDCNCQTCIDFMRNAGE